MPKAYHVLKPVWCLFFVGSHKCAYPTDIEVISDGVKSLLFPPVFPDFPAPGGTQILFQPSRLPARALDHSATKTHFRSFDEKEIYCGIFPPAMIDSVLNYSIKWTDAFSLRKASFKGKENFLRYF